MSIYTDIAANQESRNTKTKVATLTNIRSNEKLSSTVKTVFNSKATKKPLAKLMSKAENSVVIIKTGSDEGVKFTGDMAFEVAEKFLKLNNQFHGGSLFFNGTECSISSNGFVKAV